MTLIAMPGFTLMELVVVLAIAALVFVVGPSLSLRNTEVAESQRSMRDVRAVLVQARSLAIFENRVVPVLFDLSAPSVRIDDGGPKTKLPENVGLRLISARPEHQSDSLGIISFHPDGSSSGGALLISADDRHHEVRVEWLTGRILVAE